MGFDLIFSDHGWLVYRQEQRRVELLQSEVAALKYRHELMARQVLRLRNDPHALEELVHRELGYVHSDEYVLMLSPEMQRQLDGNQ